MSALAASCLNVAIEAFQKGALSPSTVYFWLTARFDPAGAYQNQLATVASLLQDRMAGADADAALRLKAFAIALIPSRRADGDRFAQARLVSALCEEAASALAKGKPIEAAAATLSALALDPTSMLAQTRREETIDALYLSHQAVAHAPPSLDATLTLALAVAMGATDQRRALMNLLRQLGDFATILLLCDQIDASETADFQDRLEAVRQRSRATSRLQGMATETADQEAAKDARDWLLGHGRLAGGDALAIRRALLDLEYEIGAFASVLTLCDEVEATDAASMDDRLEAVRRRAQATSRLQGLDRVAADAQSKLSIQEWLLDLGSSVSLDSAALRLRVTLCFKHRGYRQNIDDLRELQRRDPNDAWVAQNLCGVLPSVLHPEVAASADLLVRSAGGSEASLRSRLTLLRRMGATPQALELAERLAEQAPEFAAIAPLHKMATDLDAQPAAILGRARFGRPLLYANLVCWGEKYIDLMEQVALASLLAPGNIPALAEKADVVIELFTMPADLPRLKASPALDRLGRHCEIQIRLFPAIVAGQGAMMDYTVYGFASHATILRGERDGADLTFLYPDVIYADGCYARIAERLTASPRAVFADGLNAYSEPMLAAMQGYRQADALVIKPNDLIETAVQHLSKRTLQSIYPSGNQWVAAQPTRIIFPMQDGLRIHAFILLPAYVSHAAYAPVLIKDFATPDGLFSEHVLNGLLDDEIEVLSGLEFCFSEVCENDGTLYPLLDKTIETGVRDYFTDYGPSRRRYQCFAKPIDYPTSTQPFAEVVSETEVQARMEGIRDIFRDDPFMVDIEQEQERVRRRCYPRSAGRVSNTIV